MRLLINMNDQLFIRLSALKRKIGIAVIGMGSMGKGIVFQSAITPGIGCAAVIDKDPVKAEKALKSLKLKYIKASRRSDLLDAVSKSAIALCEDPNLITSNDLVDAVIEASDSILEGAEIVISAINSGKHAVMMNAEVDQVFGPYLRELARKKGVVYTSCDGDQHAALKRLIDEMRFWGFKLVMAGNIKGYLNRHETPTSIIKEADIRGQSHRMCAAMADGTKMNIEMSLISNALGLRVVKAGMTGPKAENVKDVLRLFDFKKLYRHGEAVADYILGAYPGGGVFAVGYCGNPYQAGMMKYYKMGDGPFYLFYRPYHLCHIEAMRCVAEACLDRTAFLVPEYGFKTNVIAYTKRDIEKGKEMDGLGGFDCYGLIENSGEKNGGLPVCLSEFATLKRAMQKNQRIGMEDVIFKNIRPLAIYKNALSSPFLKARRNLKGALLKSEVK
jgi:predicted homoserine dehydrogenase-like protein